ncbi:MAG: acyl-protein synthetase [Gammaproteobacteria bacterium]|nr:MAG: acyl-protein synthetase [Gammaproteobacteria bacterium]
MERANISISDLSLSQKLDLMESIWNDLSTNETSLKSPDWHKEILDERNSAHKQGKLKASNWSDAKKRIKRNLGCE